MTVLADLAVIGGSGLYAFLADAEEHRPQTPYGPPSDAITVATVDGRRVAFLPRHGKSHQYPPHRIPYRANLWALHEIGVRRITGFNRVSGSVGTVDLSGDPDKLREAVLSVRVFAGYAGWAAGQLEGEISSGSWFVFDALPGDAFVPRPDDLWPMVLRRQGGITAAVAIFPADPAMN